MSMDMNDPDLREAAPRKAEFREVAREIVSKDREWRKVGRSVDTGGAITRAMEMAYKLGLSHGSNQVEPATAPHAAGEGIAWTLIPSRSRSVFERIVAFNLVVMRPKEESPWPPLDDVWRCYQELGTGYELANTFAKSTFAPLVRLGLMQERELESATVLDVTPLGAATYGVSGFECVWSVCARRCSGGAKPDFVVARPARVRLR